MSYLPIKDPSDDRNLVSKDLPSALTWVPYTSVIKISIVALKIAICFAPNKPVKVF